MKKTILTKLVRQYKKTKDDEVLEKIFELLEPMIIKKTRYIFNKFKYYKINLQDIKQELYLLILTIIDNYKISKPFENYLFSSLKKWLPESMIQDKRKNEKNREMHINIKDTNLNNQDTNLILEDIFNECKTENERQIYKLYLENPNITGREIGKELGMTRQNICLIIKKLRKRLKKYLTK